MSRSTLWSRMQKLGIGIAATKPGEAVFHFHVAGF
jgi:hypothetical protein